MSNIYSPKQREYIYKWMARNPERNREIKRLNMRKYAAKKKDWKTISMMFNSILLD